MPTRQIKLSPPFFDEREIEAVVSVLRSGQLSQGKWVTRFERSFARFVGIKYAVAVNNGTTALIAAMMAHGIKSGDEVIVPTLTFGATANSVLAVGARLRFADINPETYTIDVKKIESMLSAKTRAVIGVDLYGQCADWPEITKIAKKNKLLVIEDAAQAHGAGIHGKIAGSFADSATFSFYASKNMTTGEGGMVTTDNKSVYEKLLLLRDHGMSTRYRYDVVGFNWRMNEIAAALGVTQLNKLKTINQLRRKHADYLAVHLGRIRGILVPMVRRGYSHVFHEFVVRVSPDFKMTRDKLKIKLKRKGIETGIHYPYPLHIFPLYGKTNQKFPHAEAATKEVLSLPVHPGLTKRDLDFIINMIKSYAA